MGRGRGSAFDGFYALYDGTGNSAATVPERVSTKITLDYELVRLCQEHGLGVARNKPLGRFPELYPFDMLKRALMAWCEEFKRQLEAQGFRAKEATSQFRVWGPYTEKVGEVSFWTPEEGNHVIPKHERRKAAKVWGYQGDEYNVHMGVAYIINGMFERAAKHGVVSEEDGRIWV